MEQIMHSTKDYNNSKTSYIKHVEAVTARGARLSTQMGIKKTSTRVFNRNIHIPTAPSITTSYLNIYLIESIKN